MDFTKPYTMSQGSLIAGMNFLSIIVGNFHVTEANATLLETDDGKKRAKVMIGSSDMRNFMSEYAGGTHLLSATAWLNGGWRAEDYTRQQTARLYEQETHKSADGKHLELLVTFDKQHKEDVFFAYVVDNDGENVSYVPLHHSGDRLELVEYGPEGQRQVYDITYVLYAPSVKEGGMKDLENSFTDMEKKWYN